ncbi:hypothetical protein A3K73_09435 [Candidatus Pacearchaeota archaeon RBG_13_36_9]|nr:MAG: hypothetical protein A3K73_09435 [Candidatus Pacearchaeota archaeon RBG_13_36_9]
MGRANTADRQEAIKATDALVEQIEAFPKNPGPYRSLYEVGVSLLDLLENRSSRGIIFREITGDLGDSYVIAFHRRLFFNHLYVVLNPMKRRGGIHIMERKIFHRQPIAAWRYKCGEGNQITEAPDRIDLDL